MTEINQVTVVTEHLTNTVLHIHDGVAYRPDWGGTCLGCLSSRFPVNGFGILRCECGEEWVQQPGGEVGPYRLVTYWECPTHKRPITIIVEPAPQSDSLTSREGK